MVNNCEILLKERDAAAILAMSVKTLQAWRLKGGGPPFIRLGRAVRYDRRDLECFIESCRKTSTSQY